MSKHTPGPWVFGGTVTAGAAFDGIAQMIDNPKWNNGTVEANAYLIAASPELLESVQWHQRDFCYEACPKKIEGEFYRGHHPRCQQLALLIAKAEGKLG